MITEDVLLLEGKSVVQETGEDGDLIIVGYAASFDGVDREGENFVPGAFKKAIRSFLAGSAALCYHHRTSMVLGKVLSLEEVKGVGLKMVARVDGAIRHDPNLAAIYQQIKRGTISGLSIGGFFRRSMTPNGPRISDMDFTEISCTAVPTLATGTSFTVAQAKALEAKALMDEASDLEWLRREILLREAGQALALADIKLDVAAMLLR